MSKAKMVKLTALVTALSAAVTFVVARRRQKKSS
jgi:hypothetical protein